MAEIIGSDKSLLVFQSVPWGTCAQKGYSA
jgi:hypothetical protein